MLGLVRRVRGRAWRAFDQWNERRFGITTSGEIKPEELGFPTGDHYHGGLYIPSSWVVLRHLFKTLAVTREDVFVDYGSGKGRVLIFAAQQPFKRVIGVEMFEAHHRVARRNLERNRDRFRCGDVELITADATEWRVPDDLTIAYFYAPFPWRTFNQVLQQLFASLDRHPRRLRLVYYFMTDEDREFLMETGRAQYLDYKVPWYLRKQLSELWIFDLST
jgi:SAM-dependent methyltransferase